MSIKLPVVSIFFTWIIFLVFPMHSHSMPEKVVTIIGTSDLQGAMSGQSGNRSGSVKFDKVVLTGGIARIATIVKEVKAQNPASLMISSGDDLMGRFFHFYKGRAIFTLMTKAGYDVVAPGNHEFDKGIEVLSRALDFAGFNFLCSDLVISNEDLKKKCKKYLIKDLNGTKVGLFSIMTPRFNEISAADDVSVVPDHKEFAKRMIRLLKNLGANMIVAITHQGVEADKKLAQSVKGIDLIFGGHSHSLLKEPCLVNGTVIVNPGEQGLYVVRVDVPINGGSVLHSKINVQIIPVDSKLSEERAVKATLSRFQKGLPKEIVLGITKRPWYLRSQTLRRGESDVADMINDLFKASFGADIVLNNAGAFRGKKIYPPGKITDVMLDEIDQFKNCAYLFRIKGKYLKQILEHSAFNFGQGGFLQVSGLRYKINLGKRAQIIKDGKIIQEGSRIERIEIVQNGRFAPVDPDRDYKVVSNSFLVDKGGDGYFWFKRYGHHFENTYATFSSLMACYLKRYGELTPKGKDGRIEIVNE